MVQPIIDEEKRRSSMVRCPEFEGCDCELCPLDPYLRLKVFVPGRGFCPWYDRFKKDLPLVQIPSVVADKLPIYVGFLFLSGLITAARPKKSE